MSNNNNDKENAKMEKSQYEYGSIPEVSNGEEEGSTTSSNGNSNNEDFDYEAYYRDSLSIRTSPAKKAVFGFGAAFIVVFLLIAAVGNNGPATMQKARSAPLRNVSQQRVQKPWILAHGPKPMVYSKNESHNLKDNNVTATDENEEEKETDRTVEDDDKPLDKGEEPKEDKIDSSYAQKQRSYYIGSISTVGVLSLLVAGLWQ